MSDVEILPGVVSIRYAAAQLNKSRRRIRQLIIEGKLKSYLIEGSNQMVVDKEGLRQYTPQSTGRPPSSS